VSFGPLRFAPSNSFVEITWGDKLITPAGQLGEPSRRPRYVIFIGSHANFQMQCGDYYSISIFLRCKHMRNHDAPRSFAVVFA
jgi:hypothetical protein